MSNKLLAKIKQFLKKNMLRRSWIWSLNHFRFCQGIGSIFPKKIVSSTAPSFCTFTLDFTFIFHPYSSPSLGFLQRFQICYRPLSDSSKWGALTLIYISLMCLSWDDLNILSWSDLLFILRFNCSLPHWDKMKKGQTLYSCAGLFQGPQLLQDASRCFL